MNSQMKRRNKDGYQEGIFGLPKEAAVANANDGQSLLKIRHQESLKCESVTSWHDMRPGKE